MLAIPLDVQRIDHPDQGHHGEHLGKDQRQRVEQAWQSQLTRQGKSNSELHGNDLDQHCALSDNCREFLNDAARRLDLSARAYHRILRVARTLADLELHRDIDRRHLAEAIQYRRRL